MSKKESVKISQYEYLKEKNLITENDEKLLNDI